MRSSQGNESITLALVVAVIIGLAGGYFLIKLEERGRETAVAAAPASTAGTAEQRDADRLADEDVVAMLRDREVAQEFESFFTAACALGTQREAGAFMGRARAKQVCTCIFPWVQEKILNKELTSEDFDRLRARHQFPSREMEREFNKEVEACIKAGAA